jgi:hypothetical protein
MKTEGCTLAARTFVRMSTVDVCSDDGCLREAIHTRICEASAFIHGFISGRLACHRYFAERRESGEFKDDRVDVK